LAFALQKLLYRSHDFFGIRSKFGAHDTRLHKRESDNAIAIAAAADLESVEKAVRAVLRASQAMKSPSPLAEVTLT
jgi:hypothetical protein